MPIQTIAIVNFMPMLCAIEMVMPGDRVKMTVDLMQAIAIEQGMRFAIREGNRTVGAGVVSKIQR